MNWLSLLFVVSVLSLNGCTSYQKIAGSPSPTAVPAPATFSGRIPCADCAGIDVTLNLRDDGLYQLRQIYRKGKPPKTVAEMGRWEFDQEKNLIVLGKKKEALHTLTLVDGSTLRLLEVENREIKSDLNSRLHKKDTLDPFPDAVPMQGMFSSFADTGLFTECQSGVRFSIAREQDNASLEQSYNTTPHGQGEPLLVSIEGHLARHPAMDGEGNEELLHVDRFIKIFPDQTCAGVAKKNRLLGTTWKLIEVGGRPVLPPKGQREPFVILERKGNKMHGFGGCNRFLGTYLVKGASFVIKTTGTTRMACLKGLSLEDSFLKAMKKTEAYRIQKGILELRDQKEHILARLKAAK